MLPFATLIEDRSANRILAKLCSKEFEQFHCGLKWVRFNPGDVVYRPGADFATVYFPTSCVISLLSTTGDGGSAATGMIGNEGMLGIGAFLGAKRFDTHQSAICSVAGGAYGLDANALRDQFDRCATLRAALLQYTHDFLAQISRTAVCNRFHGFEQRLCRCLLGIHDRIQSNEIHMTQELIANMLGGRRESVTVAAGRLQDAGTIHYSRGHIRILDRPGLEAKSCECYEAAGQRGTTSQHQRETRANGGSG